MNFRMNSWIKSGLITLFLLSLASCSVLENKWFGGKDNCTDGVCEKVQGAGKQGRENWYCYGVPKDRSWNCGKEPQPDKFTRHIRENNQPGTAPDVLPDQPKILADQGNVQPDQNLVRASSSEAILNQPGDFFAVQLIALAQETKVLEYAAMNGITDPLYVSMQSQDSHWYALLLGTYPDRRGAEKAKSDWQDNHDAKVQPWVRKLAPLQDAIRLASH